MSKAKKEEYFIDNKIVTNTVYSNLELALKNAVDIRKKMDCPVALVGIEYGMPFEDHKALSHKRVIRRSIEYSFRPVSELVNVNSTSVIKIWH